MNKLKDVMGSYFAYLPQLRWFAMSAQQISSHIKS